MTNTVAFADAALIIRGVTFDKSEARNEAHVDYLPVLRAGNIQQSLNTRSDLVWIPAGRVSAAQRLRLGDIAVSVSSGSATLVGKSALLDHDWTGALGAFCAIIRPRPGVHPAYLAQWFRSPAFELWKASKTRGSNIQNLQLADLAEVRIALPPLEVQVRRAEALTSQLAIALAAKQSSQAQIDMSARIMSAELVQVFQNILPIATQALSAKPLGQWSWYRLINLARLESGHTPSRRHPEWWGGDVPWLALPDIRKLHGKFAHQTTENTNDAGLANSSARLLPVGTVCVSRTASIGFVTVLGRSMATSQDFCNWVCDPEQIDPEFLMYAFMASQDSLRELGSGAVHKTIYMPTIQSFHLCAPALDEQRRIARSLRDRLAAAEALSTCLRERQAEIALLPSRLLAAAFEPVA